MMRYCVKYVKRNDIKLIEHSRNFYFAKQNYLNVSNDKDYIQQFFLTKVLFKYFYM